MARMQRDAGLAEVELLFPDDLRVRFPWVAADSVVGASYCPTDGFLLPHLIYNDGARRVRELGGEVVQNAPITGAVHDQGRLASVETPKGSFSGDLFIDCSR